MPPVPKKKHTRSRSSIRRGGIKAKIPKLTICPNCKSLKKPHHACPNCSFYK